MVFKDRKHVFLVGAGRENRGRIESSQVRPFALFLLLTRWPEVSRRERAPALIGSGKSGFHEHYPGNADCTSPRRAPVSAYQTFSESSRSVTEVRHFPHGH